MTYNHVPKVQPTKLFHTSLGEGLSLIKEENSANVMVPEE